MRRSVGFFLAFALKCRHRGVPRPTLMSVGRGDEKNVWLKCYGGPSHHLAVAQPMARPIAAGMRPYMKTARLAGAMLVKPRAFERLNVATV